MKFKFEKDMRILSDLITYCHLLGALDYHIDMASNNGVFEFTIRCGIDYVEQRTLDELRAELGRGRRREIEQDYWGLTGEGDDACELTLIGMMVDEAEVAYKDKIFTLHVKRFE